MDQIPLDSKLKHIILILQQQKRTHHQVKKLEEMTLDVPFFQEYRSEGKEFIHNRCCALMGYEYFKQGEPVIHIDTYGDKFYIILKGQVGVYIRIDNQSSKSNTNISSNDTKTNHHTNNFSLFNNHKNDKNDRKQSQIEQQLTCVKELKDGQSFGELALLQNKKRLASIICHSDCHMAILDKNQFVQVLGESEEQKIFKEMKFFADLSFFEGWNFNLLKMLFLNSYLKQFTKGQIVFKENTDSNAIFFIKSGEFEIFKHFQYYNVISNNNNNNINNGELSNNIYHDQVNVLDQIINSTSVQSNQNQTSLTSSNKKQNKSLNNFCNISASPKNQKITNSKDPLGKQVKLCILTEKELFGEEDIITGQKRTFGVRCVSFTGELIMIKLRDFQNRVMSDYRTKQLVQQRFEQKMDMMTSKINQIEKSMNLFSDYYFPKSSVINSIHANSVPLFRKNFKDSKFSVNDRTFNYIQNLKKDNINNNRMGSSFSQQFQNQMSSNSDKPESPMKSQNNNSFQSLIRSQTNINNQNNNSDNYDNNQPYKLQSQQSQRLLTSKTQKITSYDNQDEVFSPLSYNVPDSSNVIKSSIFISPGKNKRKLSNNLQIQTKYLNNINKSHILIADDDQSMNNTPLKKSNINIIRDIPFLNMTESVRIKSSNNDETKIKNDQIKSHRNILQDDSIKKDLNGGCISARLINTCQSDQTKNINKETDELNHLTKTKSIHIKIPSFEEISLNKQSNTSQNQNNILSSTQDQFNKSQRKQQMKDQSPAIYQNEMTEGFYKNLRVNYLAKFKNQNVQNLKKHIQSSLINGMPENFSPLDCSDLSKSRKKIKPKQYQLFQERFMSLYKNEIRQREKDLKFKKLSNSSNKIISENDNNKNSNLNMTDKEISSPLLIQDKKQNYINNSSRIHSQEMKKEILNQINIKKSRRNSKLNSLENDQLKTQENLEQQSYVIKKPFKYDLSQSLKSSQLYELISPLKNNSATFEQSNQISTDRIERMKQSKKQNKNINNQNSNIEEEIQKLNDYQMTNSIFSDYGNIKDLSSKNYSFDSKLQYQSQQQQPQLLHQHSYSTKIETSFSKTSMSTTTSKKFHSPKQSNSAQNLYFMHLQKQEKTNLNNQFIFQKLDNKQSIKIIPDQLEDSKIIYHNNSIDFKNKNMNNNSFLFEQSKFEQLKQIKKPKYLSGISQFLHSDQVQSSEIQSNSKLKQPTQLDLKPSKEYQLNQTLPQFSDPKSPIIMSTKELINNNSSIQNHSLSPVNLFRGIHYNPKKQNTFIFNKKIHTNINSNSNNINNNKSNSSCNINNNINENNNSHIKSIDFNLFKTFKVATDRKVISKFEQQIQNNIRQKSFNSNLIKTLQS